MKLRALIVGCMVLWAGQARAEHAGPAPLESGGYFGAAAGYNLISGGHATDLGRVPSSVKFDFHGGGAGSISAGYKWEPGLRTEVEVAYRLNNVKDFNSSAFPITGRQEDVSLMLNFLYDFRTGTRFTPYIGLGVGAAMVWWKEFASASSAQIVDSNGSTKIALQGILGGAYAVGPQFELTLDVRYKGSNGHSFKGIQAVDTITGFQLRDTTIMAGIRYGF